jgi:hypothetical protein
VAKKPRTNKRARQRASEGRALMVIQQPEAEQPRTGRFGRTCSKFRPEFIDQARVLCQDGMTDAELGRFFGVSRSTIDEWRFIYPEFGAAMKMGKEEANDRLERRSYEVAMGFTSTVTETVKLKNADGSEHIVTATREVTIPPNPDMLRWMLKNRRPDVWRDKTEVEAKSTVVHLTVEEARAALAAKLEHLKLQQAKQPQG